MLRAADFVPRSDREIVLGNIRSQLLTLETIRPWEKNADNYSSTCANGAFVLMERKFAPPDERLRSLIAREKQMPALLAEARVNLEESAAHLHRDRHRAVARHHQLLSARCAAGLRRCQGPGAEGGVRADQCGSDRGAEELSRLAEDRPAARVQRRLPHRRRDLLEEARVRRDGRHPAGQAA